MDTLLIKVFATALTLSQVTTSSEAVKTFDPVSDQGKVVSLLRAGCVHLRKAFDIEDINIDDLIATAMDDPEAVAGSMPVFHGINFNDLLLSYRQFCRNETVPQSPVDLKAVIEFYNTTLADLPDVGRLRNLRTPGASIVLDRNGEKFAEVYDHDQRRVFISLAEIPNKVQRAFIAAEDKRFYQHKGIDERALVRAFIGNLAQSGRPQGGSTITQQVIKNLLVGPDVSYERKMREMVLTTRLERLLSKNEILELYFNSIYLGRGVAGIEAAATSYFGKSARNITTAEAALLAALVKGPNFFNPDRHPERALERYGYVLTRMQEDGIITADEDKSVRAALPRIVNNERERRNFGWQFADQVTREAKTLAGIDLITGGAFQSFTLRSTIVTQLQRSVEAALQNGLARYEISLGRAHFTGPEGNLAQAIQRLEADPARLKDKPVWQEALLSMKPQLYDVHWPLAVVISKSGRNGENVRVGLNNGRVLPLSLGKAGAQGSLKLHDVVFVEVSEGRGRSAGAELRVRPTVQGAAVILENRTGRILAMTGGFSYPLSQLNRVTQSQRQPGSALKPLTYLAALQTGLQPNTRVRDEPITLPPLTNSPRDQDYWRPKNYDGRESGITTLRRALEQSKNLATVNLLDGAIDVTPALSLERICSLAIEAQIYKECVNYYPFVLGAQPVRPIDLAAFYAAIANEGLRPTPHVIDTIEHKGVMVYRHPLSLTAIRSADNVSFFQLKTMLQGVLARGTAHAISKLSPYVAGKTGTTDGENDAWFVGFTNDVTVAVWVGYDNADGKRRTLGNGQTGATIAVPIFEAIMPAVWAQTPKAVLSPPSAEARRNLIIAPPGAAFSREGRGNLVEYFRRDPDGQASDTEYQLVGPEEDPEPTDSRDPDTYWVPWTAQPRSNVPRRDAPPQPPIDLRPPAPNQRWPAPFERSPQSPWGGFFRW